MYNLYSQIKKEEDEIHRKMQEKQEKNIKIKRKKEVEKLAKKYDDRMKNFVYDMIGNPIKIKDLPNRIETVRANQLEEESNKILGRKGMVFKTFQTEKQRVDEYLKNINFTKAYNMKARLEYQEFIEKEKENNLKALIQPKMRYKPRTDLERIFDVINQNSFGTMSKSVLNSNLRNLDPDIQRKKELILMKNMNIIDADRNKLGLKLEKKKSPEKETLIQSIRRSNSIDMMANLAKKQMKLKKRVDNSGAKMLMKELYNKTHFKAASSFTLFGNPSVKNPFKNSQLDPLKTVTKGEDSQDIIPTGGSDPEDDHDELTSMNKTNFSKFNRRASSLNTTNGFNNTQGWQQHIDLKQNPVKNGYIRSRQILGTEYTEYIKKNAMLSSMKLFEEENDESVEHDSRKLNFLKRISSLNSLSDLYKKDGADKRKAVKFLMEQGRTNLDPSDDGIMTMKPLKEVEEKVKIGQDMVDKERLDILSRHILKNCNYYHDKNKNNNHSVRAREGKTAITGGMTISEFYNKYHL